MSDVYIGCKLNEESLLIDLPQTQSTLDQMLIDEPSDVILPDVLNSPKVAHSKVISQLERQVQDLEDSIQRDIEIVEKLHDTVLEQTSLKKQYYDKKLELV